jgi:hypothetical protein
VKELLQLLGWGSAIGFVWVMGVISCFVIDDWDRVDPSESVYGLGRLFVGFWVLGSAQLLWLRPGDWGKQGVRALLAMFTVTLGLIAHLWHVRLAFAVYHGDSHAAAVEHTRQTAGVGWGMYVNYLFAAVWLADTLWLTAATRSYARRPQWVGWAVHGFLAFVVFNATVVYGQPATRWAGIGWFAILGSSWWRRRRLGERGA